MRFSAGQEFVDGGRRDEFLEAAGEVGGEIGLGLTIGQGLVKLAEPGFRRGDGLAAAASAGLAIVTPGLTVSGLFHFLPREMEILAELPPYPR
jgi:hypothetical protein